LNGVLNRVFGERWRTVRTAEWEASYCILFLKYRDIF